MTQPGYRIVSRGEVRSGFTQSQVRANLGKLCKFNEETLEKIFSGRPFVFKAGLDAENAQRYQLALQGAGIVCSVEPMPAELRNPVVTSLDSPRSEVRRKPPVNEITCPKCGLPQEASLTCSSCGIAFAKYQRQRESEVLGEYPAVADNPGGPPDRSGNHAASTKIAALVRLITILTVVIGGGYYGLQYFGNRGNDKVVIYTIGNDEICNQARSYLNSQGVAYVEYVIDASEENTKKFLDASKGQNTAPLAFIGGVRVDGYKPAMYQIAVAKYKGSLDGKQIIMYSSATCGYCKLASNFFAKHNIDYVELDIASSENLAKYHQLGGIGTPLIMVGNVRIDGFDEEALTLAMQASGRL